MPRRRIHQSARDALSVDERLLAALDALYGPFDDRGVLDELTESMQTLHRGLTDQRKKFLRRPYLKNPKLLRAYASYAVCAQAPKLEPVLDRLKVPQNRPLRILELGCGPGTAVAGFGLWAKDRGIALEHVATDRVPEALEAVSRLSDALDLSGVSTHVVDLSKPIARQIGRQEKFDVALFMNVLNEIPLERISLLSRELVHWLNPDGCVVIIEPAARGPARHVLEIRDMLVERGWFVSAPCPHQNECPAFANEADWCHDAWSFSRPEFMAAIDRKIGTRRESLKATWLIFEKSERLEETRGRRGRLVSDRFEEKGRTHARLCTAEGLLDLELQKRDVCANTQAFAEAMRFDLLEFEGTEQIGRRERLVSSSRCHKIEESN